MNGWMTATAIARSTGKTNRIQTLAVVLSRGLVLIRQAGKQQNVLFGFSLFLFTVFSKDFSFEFGIHIDSSVFIACQTMAMEWEQFGRTKKSYTTIHAIPIQQCPCHRIIFCLSPTTQFDLAIITVT